MIGVMLNRKGFTLVELLVAAALFATVVVVAVNIFILTLRKPLLQIDNQHLQEEIVYAFELMEYELSQAKIDYAYYSSITNPLTELYYLVNGAQMKLFLTGGQIIKEDVASGVQYPLTTTAGGDIIIDDLILYAYPETNPSNPTSGPDYQEAVVVYVSGHSVLDPATTFAAQTFITFRSYVR